MFVSVYVVFPKRGSECVLLTSICKSAEYHRSDTTVIGCSLPISPAGIVRVIRVPSTFTPSIVCLPSDSLVAFAFIDPVFHPLNFRYITSPPPPRPPSALPFPPLLIRPP